MLTIIIFLFILIQKWIWESDWSSNQFLEHGHWFEWHASCKTWDGYSEWSSWNDNFSPNGKIFLNLFKSFNNTPIATTNLCDWNEWPDGKYYSLPVLGWADCTSSCSSSWAYQSHWFVCPSGEHLNLDDMTCVPSWDSSTQVQIKDPQLSDISLWRSFNYYVNPLSESVVELGTQTHPYKDIESAIIEILNFHSHSERTIKVYVMEGSTVFINSPAYFVNITHVQIESYSNRNTVAGMARMIGIYNESKILPPSKPSKFNILSKRVY